MARLDTKARWWLGLMYTSIGLICIGGIVGAYGHQEGMLIIMGIALVPFVIALFIS